VTGAWMKPLAAAWRGQRFDQGQRLRQWRRGWNVERVPGRGLMDFFQYQARV
jgi:hypothetical protein